MLGTPAHSHIPAIFVPQKLHLPSVMSMRVTAKMSRSTTVFLQLGHQVVPAPSSPGTLPIGSGTMGQQIGFQCAISGFDVNMYDISDDALEKALERMGKLSRHLIRSGQLTEESAEAAFKRIRTFTDAQAAGEKADFVSESVPEDPKLKGRVFAQFNEICPPHAIFTTNTSSLIPSMFAEATGRPDRFAAFHFHDTRVTKIVDIMPHPGTSTGNGGSD